MEQSKLILLTCAHGRGKTVIECVNNSPNIKRVIVYSDDSDAGFLKQIPDAKLLKYKNDPLSEKWNHGLQSIKKMDFDGVILMGSDDYFNQRFLEFVTENISKYDMIGFTDLYFKDEHKNLYYWSGYKNHRRGEPAGAGKTYSKEYLQRIGFNLFPCPSSRGLDGQSWVVTNFTKANMLITSLKQHGLFLCDVKDGQGITPLASIKGISRV